MDDVKIHNCASNEGTCAPNTRCMSPKHQAIVDAATKLFLDAGYGAVSMDAIAAEAEVSKRTVYCHFSGKDGLFAAVMASLCERAGGSDRMVEILDPARHPKEALTRFGIEFLTLLTSQEGIAIYRVVVAEAGRFPELGEVFYNTGPKRTIEGLSAFLAEKHSMRELTVPNPAKAAEHFVDLIKGGLHLRLVLGVAKPPTTTEITVEVDAAVKTFLRCFQPELESVR